MRFLQKIKAGTLQYVLVISTIIAIVIFSFISVVYLQQRMALKFAFGKEAIANTQLSFDYFTQKQVPYNELLTLNFLDNTNSKTTLLKKHWGIFDIVIATSKVKNEYFEKIGLAGKRLSQRDALFLSENNQSLVLVGNTKISGDALLPKQGVKSGNIAGISYYGKQYIYGTAKNSNPNLPTISNITSIQDLNTNLKSDSIDYFTLEEDLRLHQSFSKKTMVCENRNAIVLENMSLTGNILISSETSIKILATALLEDVILIAPEIIIESNTIGNFQAIASKEILVKSNCTLKYPTALILLEQEIDNPQQVQQPTQALDKIGIHIEEKSEVRGVVLYYSDSQNNYTYATNIRISPNSQIYGEVYCTKNLELQGSVYGSVYTHHFILKKSGGIYVNHLYDAEINSQTLSQQFAGLQLEGTSNSIAKWVN